MQFNIARRVVQRGLERTIEQQIMQRTWGRVHRLQVELADKRMIVRGCTTSYYSKQLALEAALDMRDEAGTRSVQLDIAVDAHPLFSSAPEQRVNRFHRRATLP